MNTRLWSLAAGALAMGTGAIAVAGLLPALALDMNVSAAMAGQLVVIHALAFAIAAPLAAFVLASMCRRRVLLLGLALFTLGTLASALAPSFAWLMVARVVAGIGAAIFTPSATVVAASLVPVAERGRAIATVFGGFTLASVVAVPVATWLGGPQGLLGWRGTMALIAALGALTLARVAQQIRGHIQAPPARAEQWRAALTDRRSLLLLATTGVAMAGTFVVFAFVAPFLLSHSLPSWLGLASLMMVIGVAGASGTALAGRYVDRVGAARFVAITLGMAIAGLALLALGGQSLVALLLGLLLWGAGAFGTNAAQQARLVAHAPQLAGALLPANASVLSAGQAAGGVLGGLVLASAPQALPHGLPAAGLAVVAVALVLSWLATPRAAFTSEPVMVGGRS